MRKASDSRKSELIMPKPRQNHPWRKFRMSEKNLFKRLRSVERPDNCVVCGVPCSGKLCSTHKSRRLNNGEVFQDVPVRRGQGNLSVIRTMQKLKTKQNEIDSILGI